MKSHQIPLISHYITIIYHEITSNPFKSHSNPTENPPQIGASSPVFAPVPAPSFRPRSRAQEHPGHVRGAAERLAAAGRGDQALQGREEGNQVEVEAANDLGS